MKVAVKIRIVTSIVIWIGCALLCAPGVFSQTDPQPPPVTQASQPSDQATPPPPSQQEPKPALSSVLGIKLGMSVDEVKKQLGKPEVSDDTGMFFTVSGGNSVQVGLDANKKVRTVASIYAAGSTSAPSIQDVFGNGEEEVKGDTYKIVRYPDAGYWIAYSRTNSKNKPIVVVTMRKIF